MSQYSLIFFSVYSLNDHRVYCKIEQLDAESLQSFGNLDDVVRSLSDVDLIKKTYLSTEQIENMAMEKYVQEEIQNDKGAIQITEDFENL